MNWEGEGIERGVRRFWSQVWEWAEGDVEMAMRMNRNFQLMGWGEVGNISRRSQRTAIMEAPKSHYGCT